MNVKPIFSFINELIRKEMILIKEDLHDKYKEKKIRIVKLVVSEFSLKVSKLTIKQRSFIDAYLKLKELYPKKQYKIA